MLFNETEQASSGDHVFLSEMLLLPRGFTHFEGDIKKKGSREKRQEVW